MVLPSLTLFYLPGPQDLSFSWTVSINLQCLAETFQTEHLFFWSILICFTSALVGNSNSSCENMANGLKWCKMVYNAQKILFTLRVTAGLKSMFMVWFGGGIAGMGR